VPFVEILFELNCAELLAALRFVDMHVRQMHILRLSGMFACSVVTLTLVLWKDSYKWGRRENGKWKRWYYGEGVTFTMQR
jgi:hypothetical protein